MVHTKNKNAEQSKAKKQISPLISMITSFPFLEGDERVWEYQENITHPKIQAVTQCAQKAFGVCNQQRQLYVIQKCTEKL